MICSTAVIVDKNAPSEMGIKDVCFVNCDFALFISIYFIIVIMDINDLFSVQSRCKQCAFMSLSALLTAQNIPLIDWSETTFINNVLLRDKMYLQALNDGFIVLEPGVEFLSVDNIPKLVSISSCIQTCFLQDM